MSRAASIALLLLWAFAFAPSAAEAADECPGICPLGQVCVEGRCVPQAEAPPQQTPPPATDSSVITPTTSSGATSTTTPVTPGTSTIPIQTHSSAPVTHGVVPVAAVPHEDVDPWENLFSITVDPIGFLLYGPSLKFEVGTMVSGYTRVRFPNVGLVHIAQNISDTEFDWGISAGGGIRGYVGRESQQGFLFGAGFEIAYTVRSRDFNRAEQWSTTSFLPALEIGYRIVASSGFTFTVSGGVFYVINIGFESNAVVPVSPTQDEVFPILQLDLGYNF